MAEHGISVGDGKNGPGRIGPQPSDKGVAVERTEGLLKGLLKAIQLDTPLGTIDREAGS